MEKNSVFLAAPISGCADEEEYQRLREQTLGLIAFLRSRSFVVFSEIEEIYDMSGYDSPAESVKKDFRRIAESDCFVMIHPRKMQTSALIELGFAYAGGKKIAMIGPVSALPYMALGMRDADPRVHIIEATVMDDETYAQIADVLS